jgi:hypothetical protein
MLVYTEVLLILQYALLALSRCICDPALPGGDDKPGGCIALLAGPQAQHRWGLGAARHARGCGSEGAWGTGRACMGEGAPHARAAGSPSATRPPCGVHSRLRVLGLHSSAPHALPIFLVYLSCLVLNSSLDEYRPVGLPPPAGGGGAAGSSGGAARGALASAPGAGRRARAVLA